MSLNEAINAQRTIVLDYTNHRGERAMRSVVPQDIYFGTTEWHPELQWLMDAFDVEKKAERTFAMTSIHGIHAAGSSPPNLFAPTLIDNETA